MNLSISGKNMKLNDTMKERIEQRIYFALSRFSPRISRVSVTVEDINGPRGGIDKRCRILVKLDRMEELQVEITDADIDDAVAAAADRMGRSVQRKLDRGRTVRRSGQRSKIHDPEEEEPTTPSG
jgi:putative sigma-54 modulation protein